MNNYELLDAVGGIDAEYVESAARKKMPGRLPLWAKIVPAAACLCLLVGAAALFQPGTPNDIAEDPTISSRGGAIVSPSAGQTIIKPVITGDRLSVFKNSPIGIDDALVQSILASAMQAGWNRTDCVWHDEYSFALRGESPGSTENMSQDELLKNTQDFLRDSGLEDLLAGAGMAYELETESDDGIALSFCYLLCDGERTGAYVRCVFEGSKVLGECQAFVYASERIDSLAKLSFEEASARAFCVRNHELVPVDVAEYTTKNEKIVYVNGLPYYSFHGTGINSRSVITGYALAVDIETSPVRDTLMELHLAFNWSN